MQYPQVLVYEKGRQLAGALQELIRTEKWVLREVRAPEEVQELLANGGPSTLILKIGRDLEAEFTLLESVTQSFPTTRTVIVGESSHMALAGLSWDLGAAYVLFFPYPGEWLPTIVRNLMTGEEELFPIEADDEGGASDSD